MDTENTPDPMNGLRTLATMRFAMNLVFMVVVVVLLGKAHALRNIGLLLAGGAAFLLLVAFIRRRPDYVSQFTPIETDFVCVEGAKPLFFRIEDDLVNYYTKVTDRGLSQYSMGIFATKNSLGTYEISADWKKDAPELLLTYKNAAGQSLGELVASNQVKE